MSGGVNCRRARTRYGRRNALVHVGAPHSFVRDGIDHADDRHNVPERGSVLLLAARK